MQTQPLILKPWLRIIFFLTVVLMVGSICISVIENIIKKGWLGFSLQTAQPIVADTVSYAIQQLITIAIVFITVKYVDKQSFKSIGFAKGFTTDAVVGLLIAVALILLGTWWLQVEQYIIFLGSQFKMVPFFCSLILFVLVAFAEEIMLRGYILNNLMQSMNRWLALFISALIFCTFHLGNPNITAIAIINMFLAGIILGLNYVFTRNLWFAIVFHFVWNFLQGPVLGFAVSGLFPNNGIFIQQTNGPTAFTGGLFGFEASIVCTILLVLFNAILFVYFSKKYRK